MRSVSTAGRLRSSTLCALLCLALVAPLLPAVCAQSGRNKGRISTAPRPTATPVPQSRQRRVATESTGSTTSTQKSAPAQEATKPEQQRVPSDPSLLGPPPTMPTPVPRPTPAAATTAPSSTAGEEIEAEDVVRINSNLVTVPASVIDERGYPVKDLTLQDFELRVDGQPKLISDLATSDATPVTMAVLFDNSSSLTAAREFEKQAAIRFFRSVVRPIDKAAIYSVSTYPVLEQPLTNDVRTLVRTIERFGKPEGATALFDAIVQAAAYLKPYQEGRKVIVLVSDGADTISDIDFDSTLRRVQAADCQIYAVQTGHIENANLRDLAAERRLQDFAAQTGGAVYVPRGTGDLDAAFAQILADLAQQYVLSYYPTNERRDDLFRTISVRVTTRPNLRVRARKGYYPRRTTERFSGVSQGSTSRPEQVASLDRPSAISSGTTSQADHTATQQSSGAGNMSATAGSTSSSSAANGTGSRAASPAAADVGPPSAGSGTRASEDQASTAKTSADKTGATATNNSARSTTPGSKTGTEPASSTTRPAPAENKPAQPAPAQTLAPSVDIISSGVLNGKAVSLPVPVYPETARNARVQGMVGIEVLIDETGKIISAHALSGPTMLQAAAIAAARRARFSPTILSGKPMKVTGMIYYNFNLAR